MRSRGRRRTCVLSLGAATEGLLCKKSSLPRLFPRLGNRNAPVGVYLRTGRSSIECISAWTSPQRLRAGKSSLLAPERASNHSRRGRRAQGYLGFSTVAGRVPSSPSLLMPSEFPRIRYTGSPVSDTMGLEEWANCRRGRVRERSVDRCVSHRYSPSNLL